MSGRIVILNGVPRAGKSSLAREMQRTFDGIWLNFGVDAMQAMIPEQLRPGIGLRPGGERPDLEPLVATLYRGLFEMIAAHVRLGGDVVADLGLHEQFSRPLGIFPDARQRLDGLPVLFVGVTAPLAVIMARRNADPQGGYYAAGEGVPEPVRRWQAAMPPDAAYDLVLDTAQITPAEGVARIGAALAGAPRRSKFFG